MSKNRDSVHTAGGEESQTLEENVQAIRRWEQGALDRRSKGEQLSDWIAGVAASGWVLAAHVAWYSSWLVVNCGVVPGVAPFDPFPFPLLTITLSLETIFLALFVLASQNRLSRQAEKRAQLNLQIDLLAEREMTAVVQLLQDMARHFDVKVTVTPEQIRDFAKKTDFHALASRVDEFHEGGSPR